MAQPESTASPRTTIPTISQILDPAAFAIERGFVLLGMIAAVHRFLLAQSPAGISGWAISLGMVEAFYWLVAYALFGFVASRILRSLGAWLTDRELVVREATNPPQPVVEHFTNSEPEAIRPPLASSGDSPAVDDLGLDRPDAKRLEELQEELESELSSAGADQLAQLTAAREVNDPERVLELHAAISPNLEKDARRELDTDLSQWFLRLIHRRLRTGKIQPDLVQLATRIAEAFAHTHDGASLRASLPTLRRSAGLCPKCAKPYLGLASACPECLSQSVQPVRLPDEDPTF